MSTFLMAIHIMACLVLILVVLLQRGKGSDIGAALGGGGGNTVFGSRGAGNFLTKLTAGCAFVFMMTSLSLSYLGTQESRVSVFDEEVEEVLLDDLLEEINEESDATASGALEEIPAASDALEEVEPADIPEADSGVVPTEESQPQSP